MALLTVLTVPNPELKKKAKIVESIDDDLRRTLEDMVETMYANDGMGLAAPQVGIDKRLIVMDLNAGEEGVAPDVIKYINPEILWTSPESHVENEACISVPYVYGPVTRPTRAKIRYTDENNKTIEKDVDGLMARCIQHEIDHLDGILYIDHMSALKRELLLKKMAKIRRLQV